MTAEQWERIKTIFDAALNLPPQSRSDYLDAACSGQADIRATVDELLRNIENAGSFLEDVTGASMVKPVFRENELVAGRFRVIRLIAAGGMGEVYEVFDERLDLRVALKTIRTDLVASREAYERFKREVWIAREIPHAGICRVFELVEYRRSDDAPPIPCITMKLLEGCDLQAELKRRRPLSVDEALPIIRQIAEALQVLHDNGIVHRDLKPSNIMLTSRKDGGRRVVLTDFGLAKPLEDGLHVFETRSPEQPGAPYFQAPEVLQGGRENVASDIYALGLVIDEMVTCSRAFSAESIHGLFWQKLWDKPARPSERSASLPAHWGAVILRCLSQEPAQRYTRAIDVVHDLETGTVSDAPAVHSAQRPTRPWNLSPVGRRKLIYLGLAVPATVSLAAVFENALRPLHTSVLVFPIANETNLSTYDYLCKGTTTELLRRLCRVQDIEVYPVREPRGAVRFSDAVARYTLESQLRAHGGKIRLSVQLIDNGTGKLVWSDNFEQQLADPLALESDIAASTVHALENSVFSGGVYRPDSLASTFALRVRSLLNMGMSQLPPQPTRSPSAFHAYIRARALWDERTVPSALAAEQQIEQALRDDPNFAMAYSALADIQHVLLDYHYQPTRKLIEKARAHAAKAVELDPSLPEAHVSLAAVLQMLWDWKAAERHYVKALDLHPRFARARRWYAGMILQLGRTEEGLKETHAALQLDPFDYASQSAMGFCLFYSGKPLEAARHLEQTLKVKDIQSAHVVLGQVYAALSGLTSGAEAAAYRTKALREAQILRERELQSAPSPDAVLKFSDLVCALTYSYERKTEIAERYTQKLEAGVASGLISPATLARVYSVQGRSDLALDLLESAADQQDRELTNVKISPYFANLREHQRFQALLKRMHLTT